MTEKAILLVDALLEMATITRKGKQVFADDKLLREMSLEDVDDNIVTFRVPKEGLFPAGFTLAYFMDSTESAEAMADNKLPYKLVPDRPRFSFNAAPITDVWKKKYDKGQEAILGMVQGIVTDEEIYVDKATVRPGYKRSSIVSKLIDTLKKKHPNAVVNFSGPTKEGAAFIKKYTGSEWKPAHGEHPEF